MVNESNKLCVEDTQIKIADALKALMKTKSFDKISVVTITDFCHIHRQTFYYHFADKYELLNWICREELIKPLTENFSLDNMYEKFYAMFTTIKNDKSFYQSAFKINLDILFNYISNLAVEQFALIFADIEKENGIMPRDAKENKLLSEFFGYGISGIVLAWASNGMKETPQELTDRIRNIVNACKRLAISRSE